MKIYSYEIIDSFKNTQLDVFKNKCPKLSLSLLFTKPFLLHLKKKKKFMTNNK